jgi:thiamine biosynthesis lipoprotein
VRVERAVMGMPVTIQLRDATPDATAVERAFAWLDWVDATFSTYRASSEISRIGRGELEPRDAHPLVRRVLARCERLRRATRGAFDLRATGRVDPSGLVKGWAVDRAVALLEAAGARDLCVDAGGDVCVRGGPWRIGIRHPREPGRLAAVLELSAGAVATSGSYERGAHIVDPRTGRPPAGVQSVTIVGPELGTADAYATAAFAMGSAGPRWTARLAGYGALTITDDDRTLSTPGFSALRTAMRADRPGSKLKFPGAASGNTPGNVSSQGSSSQRSGNVR